MADAPAAASDCAIVKWPNNGGIVEKSSYNETWDDYYYIKLPPAKPAAD